MAFGAEKEHQTGHAGQIRGRQQEVACECWFTSTGRLIPLMLKLKDEDGMCRITTINDLIAVVTYYGLAWLLIINLTL